MTRRELEAAGAALPEVSHGDDVAFTFSLPEAAAPGFVLRLYVARHGPIPRPAEDPAGGT